MPIFFSHEIHEKNADMWMLTIIQHEQVKVFLLSTKLLIETLTSILFYVPMDFSWTSVFKQGITYYTLK